MHNIEIPLGQRTPLYRALEMIPALVTIGVPVTAIVLSFVNLNWGAYFVLGFLGLGVFRAFRGGVDSVRGYRRLRTAETVDWARVNEHLEELILGARAGTVPELGRSRLPGVYGPRLDRLRERVSRGPWLFTLPSETVHAVIVAAYNEPYDVIAPSLRSLIESHHGSERLVVVFAHEERGGDPMRDTTARLEREFGRHFRAFIPVEHPAGLSDEIQGKGGNISFAGRRLLDWVVAHGIDPERVLVTSLDCDNRVDPHYFDAVTFEFVRAEDPQRVSFQPISLFINNIWHAPAPTRVIAAGNSVWNLIATVRPLSLRNFASHTQPLAALAEMGFWSRRTIVEDGHQYWRSYFHFRGRYGVIPIHLAITQDAVLADTLPKTLRAQFRQLCRWAYGASDVPYVGVRLFAARRPAPFFPTAVRFLALLESHVTLAILAPMLAFGVWLPVIAAQFIVPRGIGAFETRRFIEALPDVATTSQRVALVALVATVLLTILLTPERPAGVRARRWVGMLLQWVLLPVTLFCYTSMSAISSQLRLLFGAYRERFVVTEKAATAKSSPTP